MSKEYHYAISYSQDTGWIINIDVEESAFPNGTIYNTLTEEWEYGYLGEGEYDANERDVTDQLSKALRQLNGED